MKLLLDENIAQSVAAELVTQGHVVKHVLQVGLGSTPDAAILAYARKQKYVIITHDKDFAHLVRMPAQKHSGVILLRLRNQHPAYAIAALCAFLNTKPQLSSRLVILQEEGARVL